jgi:hypothetical protein
MPITITPAPPNNTVGPGIFVHWSSDFIGPIPLNWQWVVIYTTSTEPGGQIIRRFNVPTVTGEHDHLMLPWVEDTGGSQGLQAAVQGQDVHVFVTLESPTGVQDSGAVTAKWDGTSGLGEQIQLKPTGGGGGGGLTPEQAATLTAILAAVTTVFPISSTADIAGTAVQLLTHPPLELLSVVDSSDLISGDGALTHPGILGPVNAYGVIVRFITVPVGFGVIHGVAPTYINRVIQLATTHLTAGGSLEYISEQKDFHQDGTLWMWSNFAPHRLAYSVAPGCLVSIQWIMAIVPFPGG